MDDYLKERMVEIMRQFPINGTDAMPFVQGAVYRGMQITDNQKYNVSVHPGELVLCPKCYDKKVRSVVEVYATAHVCFKNGRIGWIDMPGFSDAFDPICGWHGDLNECVIVDDDGEDE